MSSPRRGEIINEADESYQQNKADDEAGYPPNCKPGYVEKDGKCIPKKEKPE